MKILFVISLSALMFTAGVLFGHYLSPREHIVVVPSDFKQIPLEKPPKGCNQKFSWGKWWI